MSCCPCVKSDFHEDKEEIINDNTEKKIQSQKNEKQKISNEINDNIKNKIEDKKIEQEKQLYQQEAFYKNKNIKSNTENKIQDKEKKQEISNEIKQVQQGNITVETLSEADKQYFDNFFQKYKALESGGKPEFVVTIKSDNYRYIFFLTKAATEKLITQIENNKGKKEKDIFNSKVFNVTKVFPNSTNKYKTTTYKCYLIQSGEQIPLINRLEYDDANIKNATGKIKVFVFKCNEQFYLRSYQKGKALLNDQFLPEDFDFQTLHTALTKSLEQPKEQLYEKNNKPIEKCNKEILNDNTNEIK